MIVLLGTSSTRELAPPTFSGYRHLPGYDHRYITGYGHSQAAKMMKVALLLQVFSSEWKDRKAESS